MLYIYELHWQRIDEAYFTERTSQADARQDGPWEFSSPARLTEQEVWDHCNENWNIPDEDGMEIFDNYTGVPLRQTA